MHLLLNVNNMRALEGIPDRIRTLKQYSFMEKNIFK